MESDLDYRSLQRVRGAMPGAHRSTALGPGQELRGWNAFGPGADARRIDWFASARDPFSRMLVKSTRQQSAMPVWLVADLSASMALGSPQRKIDQVAQFGHALADATHRIGDMVGFVGCDETVHDDFFLPVRRGRGPLRALSERLASFTPTSASSAGLAQAGHWVGGRRALVFVASDFHMSEEIIETMLDGLSAHDVVPMILWGDTERAVVPSAGLQRVCDSESAVERWLMVDGSLRGKVADAYRARRAMLERIFRAHFRRPLWLSPSTTLAEINAHFHGSDALA